MKDLQNIKQRFGIIGNYEGLNRAIDIASQVAPTDLSVLITGESGTGKETFPQVIHSLGAASRNSLLLCMLTSSLGPLRQIFTSFLRVEYYERGVTYYRTAC